MFPFDGPAGICHRPLTAPESNKMKIVNDSENSNSNTSLQSTALIKQGKRVSSTKLIRRNTYDEVSIYPKY